MYGYEVAYTRSPGESSVYNLSIVFEDPPAPAARDELGFDTCEPAARRLPLSFEKYPCKMNVLRTEFEHQGVSRPSNLRHDHYRCGECPNPTKIQWLVKEYIVNVISYHNVEEEVVGEN